MKWSKEFLYEVEGKEVFAYRLINSNNSFIEVLNWGCTMTKIVVPDKDGNLENIILACKDMKMYIKNPSYMGALLGRTAGRICEGRITVDGVDYQLNLNYGLHQGQGGTIGFYKKVWDTEVVEKDNAISLVCKYFSVDGEENYPGNVPVQVTFTFNEENELTIDYEATTDKTTLINLSQHNYFNLSGNIKRPITDEFLKIDADSIMELDETAATTGNKIDVTGTPFDFRTGKIIEKDIACENEQIRIANGYDHTWNLNKKSKPDIYLEDITSGRTMEISTNQKHVVIYTMNYSNGPVLYNGEVEKVRHGICFETQNPPIGRNQAFLEESIIKPGEKYSQVTIYKFGLKK